MLDLSKKQWLILVLVGLCVFLVIGYYIYSVTEASQYEIFDEKNNIQEKQAKKEDINQEEQIVVHIAGQVNKPGIVKIQEGARIADIIESAGGLAQEADITNINLAYIVEDGQKIVIPSKQEMEKEEYRSTQSGETISQDNKNTEKSGGNEMVNINKANQSELEQLQGIGPSTALKIIEYRKENGNFNSIEDIKNVPGIGDAKYEAIKDNISVK